MRILSKIISVTLGLLGAAISIIVYPIVYVAGLVYYSVRFLLGFD